MLLTISTTLHPATDLGYLLYKNPARPQTFDLTFGTAHVFYPEATAERTTAALLVEVDPIRLVRRSNHPTSDFSLQQYVNDRPYSASSFLAVAISEVFGSALSGNCRERPELASTAIPLEVHVPTASCFSGEKLIRDLFEPLGYALTITRHPLDPRFPEFGEGPYFDVRLSATIRLTDLLSHLYVLLPALDTEKHYWIDEAEVDKLLRHGEGWLATHPQRQVITQRYLARRKRLANLALAALTTAESPTVDPDDQAETLAAAEEAVEQVISLNTHRLQSVMAALRSCGASTVLDLGCNTGNLLRLLLADHSFSRIVGFDVSHRSLETAALRLRLDQLPERQRARIELMHGSLTYRDSRLAGFDAAALVEVIEHLDPPRLAALQRVVFEFARPRTVVITTPNIEYNVRFETLAAGAFRHRDHRFEWTRAQFAAWVSATASRFGYSMCLLPIGPEDPEVGSATQMAVFTLASEAPHG